MRIFISPRPRWTTRTFRAVPSGLASRAFGDGATILATFPAHGSNRVVSRLNTLRRGLDLLIDFDGTGIGEIATKVFNTVIVTLVNEVCNNLQEFQKRFVVGPTMLLERFPDESLNRNSQFLASPVVGLAYVAKDRKRLGVTIL